MMKFKQRYIMVGDKSLGKACVIGTADEIMAARQSENWMGVANIEIYELGSQVELQSKVEVVPLEPKTRDASETRARRSWQVAVDLDDNRGNARPTSWDDTDYNTSFDGWKPRNKWSD